MKDKYIVHFLSKTKKKITKFIQKQVAENNFKEIDPSYGNILIALYESDRSLTMNQIVKKISKDKSTITALVKKLLALGYIEKFKSTEDKRVTFIVLTEKAKAFRETYEEISKNLNQTVSLNYIVLMIQFFFKIYWAHLKLYTSVKEIIYY